MIRTGLTGTTAERPVAFLFTDLRNSTALYERMGDAAAYEIVRRHFAFLSDIVLSHRGTIIKTIGDAVMAAFGDPLDAVKVALSVQMRIAAFNQAHVDGDRDRRIGIRLGIHAGGCVRVEYDGRVDYFGSTVNLAARLRDTSRNGDVVLSHAVAGQPGLRRLLATLPTREESLPFRGFDAPVRLVRVMPAIQRALANSSILPVPTGISASPPPPYPAACGR